jgi:phosphotransferase system  glucose/maltose/N-acetylglucosamine-specific IIC component
MWGSVLVLTLPFALDPLRLLIILLVISRPRPVQNLLAYWVGCVIGSIPPLVAPLLALHHIPMFKSFAHDLATPATGSSSTVRHLQIGIGVLALVIAAVLTVRFWARRRAQLPTPVADGNASTTMVLDSRMPPALSRLLGRSHDAAMEGGSAVRRFLARAHNAWENGSLWVALGIGITFGGTPPDGIFFLLAILVPSGAAAGTQISAAIAFVVGMLAIPEIMLVSYLAAPAKTQTVVGLLHDWTWTHRRKIVVAMCIVGGISLIAQGTNTI